MHIGDAEKPKGQLPGVFVRRCDEFACSLEAWCVKFITGSVAANEGQLRSPGEKKKKKNNVGFATCLLFRSIAREHW